GHALRKEGNGFQRRKGGGGGIGERKSALKHCTAFGSQRRLPARIERRPLRLPLTQSAPGGMTHGSSSNEGIQCAGARLCGDEICRIFRGSTCRHADRR